MTWMVQILKKGMRMLTVASLMAIVFYFVSLWLQFDAPGKLLIVKSGSMEPGIMTGSVVLTGPMTEVLSPISSPRYGVGDVVTFKENGKEFITHRITNITSRDGVFYYETKGDNNSTVDASLVRESQIFGKVVWTAPYIGKIFAYTKKPVGFVTLVVIPALYVMGMEVMSLVGGIKEKKPDTNTLLGAV